METADKDLLTLGEHHIHLRFKDLLTETLERFLLVLREGPTFSNFTQDLLKLGACILTLGAGDELYDLFGKINCRLWATLGDDLLEPRNPTSAWHTTLGHNAVEETTRACVGEPTFGILSSKLAHLLHRDLHDVPL